MMESTFKNCRAHAETANEAHVMPDLHWCLYEDGHGLEHRCGCGLRWSDEVPC